MKLQTKLAIINNNDTGGTDTTISLTDEVHEHVDSLEMELYSIQRNATKLLIETLTKEDKAHPDASNTASITVGTVQITGESKPDGSILFTLNNHSNHIWDLLDTEYDDFDYAQY